MRGKKVLVLDPQLSGPLALIAQTSLLKVSCFISTFCNWSYFEKFSRSEIVPQYLIGCLCLIIYLWNSLRFCNCCGRNMQLRICSMFQRTLYNQNARMLCISCGHKWHSWGKLRHIYSKTISSNCRSTMLSSSCLAGLLCVKRFDLLHWFLATVFQGICSHNILYFAVSETDEIGIMFVIFTYPWIRFWRRRGFLQTSQLESTRCTLSPLMKMFCPWSLTIPSRCSFCMLLIFSLIHIIITYILLCHTGVYYWPSPLEAYACVLLSIGRNVRWMEIQVLCGI